MTRNGKPRMGSAGRGKILSNAREISWKLLAEQSLRVYFAGSKDLTGDVPAGTYRASVISSGLRKAKTGNGLYCELTWKIAEGPYANRLILSKHNVMHLDQDAIIAPYPFLIGGGAS